MTCVLSKFAASFLIGDSSASMRLLARAAIPERRPGTLSIVQRFSPAKRLPVRWMKSSDDRIHLQRTFDIRHPLARPSPCSYGQRTLTPAPPSPHPHRNRPRLSTRAVSASMPAHRRIAAWAHGLLHAGARLAGPTISSRALPTRTRAFLRAMRLMPEMTRLRRRPPRPRSARQQAAR